MFCRPGSKTRKSERTNRRDMKMQLVGMEQAIGPAWAVVNTGEDSSSDDEDDIPVSSRHYASARSGPDASPHSSPARVTAKSLGSLQMFTPVHVCSSRSAVSSPHATATSGSSEADEDEDSLAESLPQDGTALSDSPELHSMLNELRLESSSKKPPTKTKPGDGVAADATETTMEDEQEEDDFFPNMMPASLNTRRRRDGGSSSSDSDIDDESDTDSLDLGVTATVWSSTKRTQFLPSSTNMAAKIEIANLSMLPSLNSPQAMNVSLDTNDDESDDEQHEGGELFMLAEGMRYSRSGEPAIQEALPPTKVDIPADLPTVDRCFGGIQLLTPKFFSSAEPAVKTPVVDVTSQVEASLPSTLASIVHHMDINLFDTKVKNKQNTPPRNGTNEIFASPLLSENAASPSPVKGLPQSVLQSENIDLESEQPRTNLSSSFKSSTKSSRVAYNLSSGKKSMSKIQRVYSKSFLPSQMLSSRLKAGTFSDVKVNSSHGALSVLLADIRSKIFEIVSCDVSRETTVGDVLSKARSLATDPALSEQKYVSFCYGDQEFGAPMLPVSVLIDWNKHKTRPLVVAVPLGSTAAEMQSVKRVLWRNPKLKDWWGQQDPFQLLVKQRPSSRRSNTSATSRV